MQRGTSYMYILHPLPPRMSPDLGTEYTMQLGTSYILLPLPPRMSPDLATELTMQGGIVQAIYFFLSLPPRMSPDFAAGGRYPVCCICRHDVCGEPEQ